MKTKVMDRKTGQFLGTISLCLLTLVVAGCAGTSQKVNLSVLEECKNKTFKIGVVKASAHVLPGNIEQKKKALARIPIDEICSTLNMQYGLKIDTNVDRSPKIVQERSDNTKAPPMTRTGLSINVKIPVENAYYGNLEYDSASVAKLMFVGNAKTINDEEVPDVVNVTYWMDDQLKASFMYSIYIKSSGKDVLELKGVVTSTSSQKGWFGMEKDAVWDAYVEYAGHINEALKGDLAEIAKN